MSSAVTVDEQMLLCCMCTNVLQHPIQLSCLHNSCAKCLDNIVGTEDSASITCAVCKDVTDVPPRNPNHFVSYYARTSAASDHMSSCSICAEEERPNENAKVWCDQCQKSLCSACLPGHARYNRQHATTSLEEVTAPSARAQQCQLHAKVFDHVCLSCAVPRCIDCGLACARVNHDVQLLGSPDSDALVVKIKKEIGDLRRTLESKVDTLRKRKNLVGDLKTARAAHIRELENKKRALLDAVDEAFSGAKAAIHRSYDILDMKSSDLASAAEQLDEKVCHALKYTSSLVDSGGITNLLLQQQVLLARLQRLAKELEQARAPLDASKYVILNSVEHKGMEKLMVAWIGTPTLVTDDLLCSVDRAVVLEAGLRKTVQTGYCSLLQHGEHQTDDEDIAPDVPDPSPTFSTFQSPVPCRDVAVSSDGCRLLLAAQEHGLLECDLSGVELSRWRPAEKTADGGDEAVIAVKALQDGRVAASLRHSRCVVLLRRGHAAGDALLEDKRINGLEVTPWRLSVHADLIAAAGFPDCSLSLLSMSAGREQSRHWRQYKIWCVAVTAQALLTASWQRVKLSDGREAWVVDACSHDGRLLWRQEHGDLVTDMCAALSGRVLYMALCEADRVTAVRVEDGSVIKDVLSSSSHSLKGPEKLSVSERGRQMVKAVLTDDGKMVTMYNAERGQ